MNNALATQQNPPIQSGQAKLQVLPPSGPGEDSTWGMVKQTDKGVIKAIKAFIPLSVGLGHAHTIEKKLSISAVGYEYLNKIMGVSRYMPETVLGDDGKMHPNPYVIRDEHDSVKRIIIKMGGFARNSIGNMVFIISTLDYDLGPMFAQDTLKKWHVWGGRDKPKAEMKWGKLFAAGKVPDDPIFFQDDGEPDPTPTQEIKIPGGYVLVVQLKSEMLDVVDSHAHRVRFAGRNAETICWRRILRQFAGQTILDEKKPGVSLTAWVQDDAESIKEIAEMAARSEDGDLSIEGTPVTVTNITERVDTTEEESVELIDEVHEDAPRDPEQPIDVGVEESTPAPVKTEAKKSEPESKSIGGKSKLYEKINKGWIPLSDEAKTRLRKKWGFELMMEVKKFNKNDADDLWADIESEIGGAS